MRTPQFECIETKPKESITLMLKNNVFINKKGEKSYLTDHSIFLLKYKKEL